MRLIERLEGYTAVHGTEPRRNGRLIAFTAAFVLVTVAGLGFTFLRAPEYRATARLEIVPAEALQSKAPQSAVPQPASAQSERGSGPANPFLTEIEFLTSRPLLEQLSERVGKAGMQGELTSGDPIAALLQSISVTPVPGTQIVQLASIGPHPEVLAYALNQLMEIYRGQVAARYRDTSTEALADAREEAQRYEAAVGDKRRALDAFRARYNIVSAERDENEALARVRGLGASLNAAEDRAVAAQAKLRSLRDAAAGGGTAVRAKDNPTLANLETRLSQLHEEMRQLERSFTDDYLTRDPAAKLLRTRIAELEAQVKRERVASQGASLAEAEEEAARTRGAVVELKSRLASDRASVQAFSARFNEYKALQEELTNLEGLLRGASEKAVRLEASDRARRPEAKIVEAAVTPTAPWRPLYLRDTAITFGAALVIGVLAAWLTAFLTRREGAPNVVVATTAVPYPLPTLGLRHDRLAPPDLPTLSHDGGQALRLAAPPPMRELDTDEVAALLASVDDRARLPLALLVSGVSPEEMLALRRRDVHLDGLRIRIAEPAERDFPLTPELAAIAVSAFAGLSDDAPLVPAAGGAPITDDLNALVAVACHDAGVSQAADITPAALRHTYLAFMVRQGVRFGELTRVAGALPAAVIGSYGALAPEGAKRALSEVVRLHPGLRRWASEKAVGARL